MGPHIDCASWALLKQLSQPSGGALRLAACFFQTADLVVRDVGRGLEFAAGGAALGGLAVMVSHRRKVSTLRVKNEELLQQQRRQFIAAAEGSHDAFYILEPVRDGEGRICDFKFSYLNALAEARFKSTRGPLVGTSYRQQMGKVLSEPQFELYCEVVASGVPLNIEFPVTVPGVEITCLRHQVVRSGDGIAITSSDRSEFKSVQNRFESVSEFSELIFKEAPFSMIAADAQGTITAMNLEAEALTGYRGDDLVGSASMLDFLDQSELELRIKQLKVDQGRQVEALDLVAGEMHAVMTAGLAQMSDRNVEEREWTFIRKDGTRVQVCLAVKVLRDQSGERTGVIGIAYDMNKRKDPSGNGLPAAAHDALTGLIGHNLLNDRITQTIKRCKRAKTKVAVLTIDLDHFKRINDALGHPVGDEILSMAANRLLAKIRGSDTVARISGDEFIVVLPDQTKISDVEFCAEQLLRTISAPYSVAGHTINVTSSVGVCLYPDFAGDTEHLLRRSEAAMYAAKESGRNRCALFSPEMLEDAYSRLSMEGALRQALDREELFIEYQPQVALPSGRVIGMEALLRWRHPRFGLVSPAHFIPMAEKIGLLSEFGMWAMQRACREAKWMQDRLGRRFSLSVNLSPHQFEQKKLLRTIEDALSESGLDASDLEIEIIENTLMINSTANLKTLQMIRDLGVGLSIDDFGTGFCNFNYLLQYQVDRLKIDQSFVRQAAADTNAASVVRTVIAMSHGLGVKVIAEGVETREQLKFLMRRRCDQAQGYFFARPLSPQQFVDGVAGIEAMNLSDPSGERAAVVIATEEKLEFVRPQSAISMRPIPSS